MALKRKTNQDECSSTKCSRNDQIILRNHSRRPIWCETKPNVLIAYDGFTGKRFVGFYRSLLTPTIKKHIINGMLYLPFPYDVVQAYIRIAYKLCPFIISSKYKASAFELSDMVKDYRFTMFCMLTL